MEATYRGLSTRAFGAGLVLFLVGGGLFMLNIRPRTAGKAYLSVLVAGPALALGGLLTMASSVRTRFCARCHHAFASASGAYSPTSEPAIRSLLETGRDPGPNEIRFSQKNETGPSVELTYCPACVAIGEARLCTGNGERKAYDLNGTIVRRVRDNLFL